MPGCADFNETSITRFLVLENNKQRLLIQKCNNGVTATGYCMRTAAGRIRLQITVWQLLSSIHINFCVSMWSHRDNNDQYSAHISASASDPVLSWIAVMPDADADVIDGKTFCLHNQPFIVTSISVTVPATSTCERKEEYGHKPARPSRMTIYSQSFTQSPSACTLLNVIRVQNVPHTRY